MDQDHPPQSLWTPEVPPFKPPHSSDVVKSLPEIFPNVLAQIGNTPLIRINNIAKVYGIKCELLAKCEFFSAAGSIKDRIALRMIENAERQGILKPGFVIIEPTSGNTGLGLGLVAAVKGYRCIVVMPEKMSSEKVDVLRSLGVEVVRTPDAANCSGPDSHIQVAWRLKKEIPNSYVFDQYQNPGNPLAHYDTTAEEILEQCGGMCDRLKFLFGENVLNRAKAAYGQLDALVAGCGTGGTITGIAWKFKEKCPTCQIIAVDPEGSVMAEPKELNRTSVTSYEVEGIGHKFIPATLDRKVIDRWIKTNDKESFAMARKLIRMEGLLCGGSSGSAMCAAVAVAKELNEGQRCVVILPDTVRNYMSKFLSDDWMGQKGFLHVENDQKSWWDTPIHQMKLPRVQTVTSTISCQDVLQILKVNSLSNAVVVDSSGTIQGIVTLGNIESLVQDGKLQLSDPVTAVIYKWFNKVNINDTLGKISQALTLNHFVIIVEQIQDNNSGESEKCEVVHSVCTFMDLITLITAEATKENQAADVSVLTNHYGN